MSVDVADRVVQQRERALALANEVRLARSGAKRRIRDGELRASSVVSGPVPREWQTETVLGLVRSVRGVGRVKALRLCREWGLPDRWTLGRLTERQRSVLAGWLEELEAR